MATQNADCLILVTDHKGFKNLDPYTITNMDNKNILDTRNILDHEKWMQAGFNVKILGANKVKDKPYVTTF